MSETTDSSESWPLALVAELRARLESVRGSLSEAEFDALVAGMSAMVERFAAIDRKHGFPPERSSQVAGDWITSITEAPKRDVS